MKKTLSAITITIIAAVCFMYLLSPIRPVEWQPDLDYGLVGDYSSNQALDKLKIIGESKLIGPEDIVLDDKGFAYTGLVSGDVVKINLQDPTQIQVLGNTGGRPLGLKFNINRDLVIADAVKGLIVFSMQTPTLGEINTLVDSFNGDKLLLIDFLDIAANGDIYFSDASARFDLNNFLYDFLETSSTGRIFKYSPTSKSTELLVDGLFFANGVALGPNDEYLLIAETGKSRLLKYQITGVDAGNVSVFLDQLPAMPDNLSFDGENTFWVGLVTLRDWRVEKLANKPWLRRIMASLPLALLAPPESAGYGFVIGVNTDASIRYNLQTKNKYTNITSAVAYQNGLVLGSLHEHNIAWLKQLPD